MLGKSILTGVAIVLAAAVALILPDRHGVVTATDAPAFAGIVFSFAVAIWAIDATPQRRIAAALVGLLLAVGIDLLWPLLIPERPHGGGAMTVAVLYAALATFLTGILPPIAVWAIAR